MALRKITPGETITLDTPQKEAGRSVRMIGQNENITLDQERGTLPARYEGPVYQPLQAKNSDISGLLTGAMYDTGRRLYEFSGNATDYAADLVDRAGYQLQKNYYDVVGYPEPPAERVDTLEPLPNNIITQTLRDSAERDFQQANVLQGYETAVNAEPSVTWDQVKENPVSWNTPRFMLEQSAISAPEMAMAFLPVVGQPLVTMTTTQNIYENRKQNMGQDPRSVPNDTDVKNTVSSGLVSASLERLGALGDVPTTLGGSARAPGSLAQIPLDMLKSGAGEAATEMAQESVELLGATNETGKVPTVTEWLDNALSAGLVGFGMGATVRGTTDAGSALINGFSEKVTDTVGFEPPPPPPGRDALADAINKGETSQDGSSMQPGEIPAQPDQGLREDLPGGTIPGVFDPNVPEYAVGDIVRHTDRFGQSVSGAVHSIQQTPEGRSVNIIDSQGNFRTLFENEGPILKTRPAGPTRDDLRDAVNGVQKPVQEPTPAPEIAPQPPVIPAVPVSTAPQEPAITDLTDQQISQSLESIKTQARSQGWNKFLLEKRDIYQAEIDRREKNTQDKLGTFKRISEVNQSVRDSILADSNLFGDISNTQSVVSKGFESLGTDRQHMVLSQMIRAMDDDKVFWSVVQSVPVDVMDLLVGQKVSANDLLHNKSMLTHRLSVPGNVSIPQTVIAFVNSLSSSFKRGLALSSAKESGLQLSGSEIPSEGDSTSVTNMGKDGRHIRTDFVGDSVIHTDINPTSSQKEAGNYLKGSLNYNGLSIKIENPKGSIRTGKDASGKEWQVQMPAHYGYIKRTEGADGEQVDVYIGDDPKSENVFIIDQIDPETGEFDEHKALIGFGKSITNAMLAYSKGFSDGKGPQRIGSITPMTVQEFKDWLKNGNNKKPVSYKKTAVDKTEEISETVAPPPEQPNQEKTPDLSTEPKKGFVGIKLSPGEKVLTTTGRMTSEFPKINFKSDRTASLTEKRVNKWLIQNAIDEARSRGDDFNLRTFEAVYSNPQQADKDSAEHYLFDPDFVFKNPPSILKPMSGPETEQKTDLAAPQQPETAQKPAENIETKPNSVIEDAVDKANIFIGKAYNASIVVDKNMGGEKYFRVHKDGVSIPALNGINYTEDNVKYILDWLEKKYKISESSSQQTDDLEARERAFREAQDDDYEDLPAFARNRRRLAAGLPPEREGKPYFKQKSDIEESFEREQTQEVQDESGVQKSDVAEEQQDAAPSSPEPQAPVEVPSAPEAQPEAQNEAPAQEEGVKPENNTQESSQPSEPQESAPESEVRNPDTQNLDTLPTLPEKEKSERGKRLQDVGEKMEGKRSFQDRMDKATPSEKAKQIINSTKTKDVFAIQKRDGQTDGVVRFAQEIVAELHTFSSYLKAKRIIKSPGRGRYSTKVPGWEEQVKILFSEEAQGGAVNLGDYRMTETEATYMRNEIVKAAEAYIGLGDAITDAFANSKNINDFKTEIKSLLDGEDFNKLFSKIAKTYSLQRSIFSYSKWDKFGRITDETEVKKQNRVENTLTRPKSETIVREDLPDYRGGRDVTPEEFKNVFGFRGVEFGEWVNAAEGQAHVNHAFDALHDLAARLGIKPEHISLGGKLGFAFGSRGSGEHAAHYEPDTNVINLTKTKGDGSVAHEWLHALDFNLRKNGARSVDLMNKAYKSLEIKIMPVEELEKQAKRFLTGGMWYESYKKKGGVFNARFYLDNVARDPIRRFSETTQYSKEAVALGKDYWGLGREIIARAWESFIYDTLPGKSPYLVNDWVADGAVSKASGYRGTPYPTGDERQEFNQFFEAFLSAIEFSENGVKFKDDVKLPIEDQIQQVRDEAKGMMDRLVDMMEEVKNGSVRQAEVPAGVPDRDGSEVTTTVPGATESPDSKGGREGGRDTGGGAVSGDGPTAPEQGDGRGSKERSGGDSVRRDDTVLETDEDAVPVYSAKGKNHVIAIGALDEKRGQKQKGRDNLKIIKLVKEIEASNRPATAEEQELLAKYTGWGSVKNAFPDGTGKIKEGWEDIAGEVKKSLTDKEYKEARRSIQYAHYTSEIVVRSMWDALKRFGLKKGTVFEPGMGIGHFAGMMPTDMNVLYSGIEVDGMTSRIARILYPESSVRHASFIDARYADNTFDAAIGNPPFQSRGAGVKYKKENVSLHNFFFLKSLDMVAPGGVVAFVTSRYSMDTLDSAARKMIADRADLVGAVRLPDTAFKTNAHTEVVTDIIFLRKRLPGEESNGVKWMETVNSPVIKDDGTYHQINEYFANNPEMVLGNFGRGTMYTSDSLTVYPAQNSNLQEQIQEAIARLPENIITDIKKDTSQKFDMAPEETKEGAYYIKDGVLMQVDQGVGVPVPMRGKGVEGGITAADKAKIEALIPVRNALREAMAAMLRRDDTDIKAAQAKLSKAYDGFVKKYGPITKSETVSRPPSPSQIEEARDELRNDYEAAGEEFNEGDLDLSHLIGKINPETNKKFTSAAIAKLRQMKREELESTGHVVDEGSFDPASVPDNVTINYPNLKPFQQDPESYNLMILDNYDEETGTAKKSDVFTKNIIAEVKKPEIKTAVDALNYSLSTKNKVDIDFMANELGTRRDAVIKELQDLDLIFAVPDFYGNQTFLYSEEYLSGHVKDKLAYAKRLAKDDSQYLRNVMALEAVQPKDIPAANINTQLGSPYFDKKVIKDFMAEVLSIKADVFYSEILKEWSIETYDPYAPENTTQHGIVEKPADKILESLLMRKDIKVMMPDPVDAEKRVVDVEKTQAAQDKAKKIQESFDKWVWKSSHGERIFKYYNDNYNNIVPRVPNGSHLTTAISPSIKLRPHQKNAVWRVLQTGNSYFAHAVGAGKAQPLDAKVLTPSGWKKMGDIAVGDNVIGVDGKPTRVSGVYPQGEKDIFKVRFSDGSETECCDEHLWTTWNYKERSAKSRAESLGKDWPSAQPKVRSLSEIRETLVSEHLGAKNHSIPIVSPVVFEPKDVKIHPYLLGVLIGDGCLRHNVVSISSVDQEIIDRCASVLPKNSLFSKLKNEKCPTWGVVVEKATGFGAEKTKNPVVSALSDLGLMEKLSYEKHIPDDYKYNSTEIRIEVLRGLMDTDGSVAKNGSCYFYTTSDRLSDDVVEIVQSLGGIVNRSIKYPKYTHNGEVRHGRHCHVLCICLPAEINPFHLKRKKHLVVPKTKYKPVRYVTEVIPVGKKQAQCIMVDHEDHLYVTDDYIVTHNTLEMVVSGMEMRRLGLWKKPMFVVPNHMLAQFAGEFKAAYPQANIFVADENAFHTDRRRRFVANVAKGDWDAVIMTASSFKKVPVSPTFEGEMIERELFRYRQAWEEAGGKPGKKSSRGSTASKLEAQIEKMENRLKSLKEKGKDESFTFEELGVDAILVDEAHYYRKLSFSTQQGSMKGVTPVGSKSAWDLYIKSKYLDTINPGRHLVLASGTPLTNTLAEVFTIQRFLNERAMVERGIETFDAWSSVYAASVSNPERQPSGAYKTVTRLAEFRNLETLSAMVREFMDVVTSDELGALVDRPVMKTGSMIIKTVKASREYLAFQNFLKERTELVAKKRGNEKGSDNMLSIVGEGRLAAIDMRLVDPTLPETHSKLEEMIDNVFQIWKNTGLDDFRNKYRGDDRISAVKGGVQLIFSDLGVNATKSKNGKSFSAYAHIRRKLIRSGVPENQIAFISDYDTFEAKRRLQNMVNNGEIRILIGSTAKMGTGLNVQNRLKAIHNLDAPWLPADIEQRVGRGFRQGNQYPEIEVYGYGTEGSYDSTMWGMLETKAKAIIQFLKGGTDLSTMRDIEETDHFRIAKAMTSGDPRVMKQAELQSDVEKLARQSANFKSEQVSIRSSIARKKSTIEAETGMIEKINDLEKRLVRPAEDEFMMVVKGKPYTDRPEATEALALAIESVKAMGTETRGDGIKIGEYYGLDLNMFVGLDDILDRSFELFLVDPALHEQGRKWSSKDQTFSVSGAITSLTNSINRLPKRKEDAAFYIERAEREIKVLESNIAEEFPKQKEYEEKRQQLEEIDKDLQANAPVEISYDDYPIDYWRQNKEEMSARFSILSDEEYSYLYEKQPEKVTKTKQEKIEKDIEAELKKLNFPKANIRLHDPETGTGSLFEMGPNVPGYYYRGLIHISMTAKDYIAVLKHEVIHALRKAGAFTDAEWKMLQEKASQWRVKYDIDRKYKSVTIAEIEAKNNALPNPFTQKQIDDYLEDYLNEEAIAYAFQNYNEKGLLERLRKRIIRFFSTIKALMTGEKYKFKTADDVFDAIASGEVAGRSGVQEKLRSLAESDKKVSLEDLSNTLSDKYGMSVAMGRNRDGIVISSFKVPDGERGMGSGTKAMKEIIKYANKARESLYITPTKDAGFYRRLGFVDNPGGSESMVYHGDDIRFLILPKNGTSALEKAKEELSAVRGIDNSLRPQISKLSSYFLHPRQIATLFEKFTPVYTTAQNMMKFRDVLVSKLSSDTKLYNRINWKSKEKINAVLELGRLDGVTFDVEDGKITVKNTKHENARLSKPGETITLEGPEVRAYYGVRKSMNSALDTYIQVVLEEFGLLERWINNSSQLSKALAEETDKAEINRLREALQIIYDIEHAKKSGYVPFKRWGEIGIAVHKNDGNKELVHYERVELPGKLKRKKVYVENQVVQDALVELVKKYPENEYTVSAFEVKDFTDVRAKINLNELDVLAMSSDMSQEDYDAMREMLSDAIQRRGFRKHFYKAGDVAGYSPDFERAINDYIISISGHLARRKYNQRLQNAVKTIADSGQTSVFEYARDYVSYITDPREEHAGLRQAAFLWYLAGNIASGITNSLQPFMVTAPWFKAMFSHGQIAKEMTRAYNDARSMLTLDSGLDVFDFDKAPADVRAAMKRAAAEGDFIPLETWDAMGGARRHSTHLKAVGRTARTMMDAISLTFSVPERMNRVITYMAGYRFAIKPENRQKILDFIQDDQIALQSVSGKSGADFAAAFADYAVFSTQYQMGKLNRAKLARGVGTLPFQFLSYSLQTFELMYRLAKVHGGKKGQALGFMIFMIVLMAGFKGIPFEDDLEDLFEYLWKNANRTDLDIETEIRKRIASILGKDFTVFLTKGLPSALLGVDMATRLGLGNIIPNADSTDLLGAWYDMTLGNILKISADVGRGDPMQAVTTVSPAFIKNMLQSYIWATKGVQSSTTGDTIIPPENVTDLDVALKFFGFTSSKISEERSRIYAEQRLSRAANDLRSDYYDRLARAYASKRRAGKAGNKELSETYSEEIRSIQDEIDEYNSTAPLYMKILINERSLKLRIMEELKGASVNKPRKQARKEAADLKKAYGH